MSKALDVRGEDVMADATKRQDLAERTFRFSLRVLKLCQQLDAQPGVSRLIANQLLRCGTSIGANVAEGQSAHSVADFANKYSIACKEGRETLYWLRLLSAGGIIPARRLEPLMNEANELVAILTASIKKLKEKRHKPRPK